MNLNFVKAGDKYVAEFKVEAILISTSSRGEASWRCFNHP